LSHSRKFGIFFRLAHTLLLASLLTVAASPGSSQSLPSAYQGGLPVAAGGGISYWDVDWGHSKMEGATLWIDYFPPRVPRILRGIGVEAEARDVSFNRGDKPGNFRHDTAGGGAIYAWRRFPSFYPYGKFEMGLASIDFTLNSGNPYTHDSRTYMAPGAGVEYRVYHHLWARVDYEYQRWGTFIGANPTPQGLTFGAMYDFRNGHRR